MTYMRLLVISSSIFGALTIAGIGGCRNHYEMLKMYRGNFDLPSILFGKDDVPSSGCLVPMRSKSDPPTISLKEAGVDRKRVNAGIKTTFLNAMMVSGLKKRFAADIVSSWDIEIGKVRREYINSGEAMVNFWNPRCTDEELAWIGEGERDIIFDTLKIDRVSIKSSALLDNESKLKLNTAILKMRGDTGINFIFIENQNRTYSLIGENVYFAYIKSRFYSYNCRKNIPNITTGISYKACSDGFTVKFSPLGPLFMGQYTIKVPGPQGRFFEYKLTYGRRNRIVIDPARVIWISVNRNNKRYDLDIHMLKAGLKGF